jgi:hypothetical protein
VAFAGCADRERSNPLDPKNQSTAGKIAGFNALAGNGQVEIRWTRLTQSGVVGYRILRWLPGATPSYIGNLYDPVLAGAVDLGVVNGETYVYRLVALLASGDSAVSPADTATPGARQIVALSAGLPGTVGLTPDARDLLFAHPEREAYEDMEIDSVRGVLWLTLPGLGEVHRLTMNGSVAGPTLVVRAADVTVSNLRGIGWVADPEDSLVLAYGPELENIEPVQTIPGVGRPHVVEAGTLEPTVWIGSEGGEVYRFSSQGVFLGSWSLGAPIVAIALDEVRASAFVATRTGSGDELYRIDSSDSSLVKLRTGFVDIADLAFDPATSSLWVSDRGPRGAGIGHLSRLTETGETVASASGLEPFGITIDPRSGTCWASDLHSNRLVEIAPSGTVLRRSAPIDVPYAVRIMDPAPAP